MKHDKEASVTIDNVAQVCGVSKSTVSRALNRPEMVSASTRKKVNDAVKLLNYHPNPIARALNFGKISVVTAVVPTVHMFIQTELVAALREFLNDHGHSLLVLDNSIYNRRTKEYMQVVQQQVCNGVVFFYEFDGSNILKMAKQMPTVSFELSSQTNQFSSVCTDDAACVQMAVEHLVQCGHTRIAAFLGRKGDTQSKLHLRNFIDAMRTMSLNIVAEWVHMGKGWGNEPGFSEVQAMMQRKDKPTALYCANGNLGMGAMVGLLDMGLSVPEDISIVCGSGPSPERYIHFPLDYVDIQPRRISTRLGEMLIAQMEGTSAGFEQEVIAPVSLVVNGGVQNL